jgi:hypothetical protein
MNSSAMSNLNFVDGFLWDWSNLGHCIADRRVLQIRISVKSNSIRLLIVESGCGIDGSFFVAWPWLLLPCFFFLLLFPCIETELVRLYTFFTFVSSMPIESFDAVLCQHVPNASHGQLSFGWRVTAYLSLHVPSRTKCLDELAFANCRYREWCQSLKTSTDSSSM